MAKLYPSEQSKSFRENPFLGFMSENQFHKPYQNLPESESKEPFKTPCNAVGLVCSKCEELV